MRRGTTRLGQIGAAFGLITTIACGPTAAPAGPTPKAATTAVASPVAPAVTQAVAVASPVATAAAPAAAQAVAAASPIGTAVAGASPVRIAGAQLSPTDSTISVQNAGSAAVDMSGWRIRVGTATATLPANSRAAPGETVTLHTASGTSTAQDIYLGQDAVALLAGLQPGANIELVDASGSVQASFSMPR